jgi:hypothetical protein
MKGDGGVFRVMRRIVMGVSVVGFAAATAFTTFAQPQPQTTRRVEPASRAGSGALAERLVVALADARERRAASRSRLSGESRKAQGAHAQIAQRLDDPALGLVERVFPGHRDRQYAGHGQHELPDRL